MAPRQDDLELRKGSGNPRTIGPCGSGRSVSRGVWGAESFPVVRRPTRMPVGLVRRMQLKCFRYSYRPRTMPLPLVPVLPSTPNHPAPPAARYVREPDLRGTGGFGCTRSAVDCRRYCVAADSPARAAVPGNRFFREPVQRNLVTHRPRFQKRQYNSLPAPHQSRDRVNGFY